MPTTIRERLRGWFIVALAVLLAVALEIEYAVLPPPTGKMSP